MYKVVLLRHGESEWNLSNRFTGWTDVDLTETGVAQAKSAGKVLKENYNKKIIFVALKDGAYRPEFEAIGDEVYYLYPETDGPGTQPEKRYHYLPPLPGPLELQHHQNPCHAFFLHLFTTIFP